MQTSNSNINRRHFLETVTVASMAFSAGPAALSLAAAETPLKRKMTMDLVCGSIGVSANQTEAIRLAAQYGFESVEARGDFLAGLSAAQLAELQADLKAKRLVFGAAGLPVEFRQDDAQFQSSLKGLPKYAAGLQQAGVKRISTWLTPCSRSLTYRRNFQQHATRLKEVAKLLKDHDIRLGLEYVGPKTSWSSQRYPFIHTMAEMKELITEIGTGNVGFLLDSWHWWNAGDTVADLLSLKNEDVVAVDLNDAPAGIAKDQQMDGKRELPCASGVIDLGAFLNALNEIGYDGPVRAEPFNKSLNGLTKEDACAATAKAMKQAFALIK